MAQEYRQRIDNNIGKLIENFGGLIKASRIRDKTHTTRESFQNAVYATSLVQACEALLKVVYELKLTLSMNDFSSMNATIVESENKHHESQEEMENVNTCLNTYLQNGLYELQGHLLQSKHRQEKEEE